MPDPAPASATPPELAVAYGEAALASVERHADRVLVVGGLVTVNLAVLEFVRHFGGPPLLVTCIALGLAASMFLLLHRMTMRTLRIAVRSARRQQRLARVMMQSVEQFAAEPAGVHGSVEALCVSAGAANCEVLVWDAPSRTLWSPCDPERTTLTASMARRLVDSMRARKPIIVPDVDVMGTLPQGIASRRGTSAMVLAPMWAGDSLVGIVLRRYASSAAMLRSQEVATVSGFAAIGAVAIGKALVVDREQQRASDNALLLRSVHLAGEGSHRDHLADYALQAAEALRATQGAIYSFVGGQLRMVGSFGVPRTLALGARRISTRSSFVSMAREACGRPFALGSDALDEASAEAVGHLGFGERLVVQGVHDEAGLVGVIVVDGDTTSNVGERETQLLVALSRQVSITIERTRMHRAISKRSRHLACTPKLARSLTGQRDPKAVARIAARELHDGFGFGRVSIALVDDDHILRIAASAGMLAQSSLPVTSTRVLNAAREANRPYVSCVGETDGDDAVTPIDDPNAPTGCRSQLVVPICGRDSECVGLIAVYERDPDALGEDDLHMLETIADQLAGTLEQAALFATLERSYFKTVEALSAALEAKDAYTLDHARSITEASAAVGRRLGMRGDEIRDLKLGALLHDIGKIGVPGEILNKPGPLDDAEFEIMKEHTIIGEQIIAPIEFLEGVRPLVLHEHERWDGAGYPHGLRGNDIPLGARIIFVCDAWHAMTSNRPYRRALPASEARTRLRAGAGSQFDPQVVEAFLEVLDSGEVSMESMVIDQPNVTRRGPSIIATNGTSGAERVSSLSL